MIRSPDLIIPLALSKEKVRLRLLSISSEKLRQKGTKPHCRFKRLRTVGVGVNANIGQSGRLLDKRDAICPEFVYTKRAYAFNLLAESSKTLVTAKAMTKYSHNIINTRS